MAQHLTEEQRVAIVGIIAAAIAEVRPIGRVSAECCCRAARLDYRRYLRWLKRFRATGRYGGEKPGPQHAPHALLESEKKTVDALYGDERFKDMSIRQVAVAVSEQGIVEVSASSVQRRWVAKRAAARRTAVKRPPAGKPEVKADRPNETWSWDMTYIRLGFFYVYLFAIIDVYSRKIVGWHLTFHATVANMQVAWDNALVNEGLAGNPDAPMPQALSDRGVQMKCKSARNYFSILGIIQLFSRCHTPTDNAWIESWFNTLKNSWLKYKDYGSFSALRGLVAEFVEFYNVRRAHGSIGMVTPEQKHNGTAVGIIARRQERCRSARAQRLLLNRKAVPAVVLIEVKKAA